MSDPLPAADKRLLFTVTTGRSGTRALSFALSRFRGVASLHEPKPKFSDALGTVRSVPSTALEFWRRIKLPRIAAVRQPIYAETSHVACKGFLEPLVEELGLRPTLLHLHRDPRAVALSLWRLDTVPGRTYRGVKYCLAPSDRCVLPLAALDERGATDYQRCYAYALEIDARAADYHARWAPLGVDVVRVETVEVATREGIAALGQRLGLGELPRTPAAWFETLRRRHSNAKGSQKLDRSLSSARLDEQEAAVRAWLGL
jgi:hypothetical protein